MAGVSKIRSGLSTLMEELLQRRGKSEAMRLERAADEVPNLEKYFNDRALEQAFLGDSAESLMVMDPAEFLDYAAPFQKGYQYNPHAKIYTRDEMYHPEYPPLMPDNKTIDYTADRLAKEMLTLPEIAVEKGFSNVPYLQWGKGHNVNPQVRGHEGRHRSGALEALGEKSMLVRMLPNYDVRESMPRRFRDEYLDDMRKRFMTGEIVPQDSYLGERQPKKLPENFYRGGLVL